MVNLTSKKIFPEILWKWCCKKIYLILVDGYNVEPTGGDMEWINIWKKEPPRNTEIWFYTGDGTVHLGEIFSEEKLRKCSFHSYYAKDDYDCDANTAYEDRVLYWFPLPELPKEG